MRGARVEFASLCLALALLGSIDCAQTSQQEGTQEEIIVGNLQAAAAAGNEPARQEESYQRVYEAFTKLVQNVSNNSLGNARRLVSRLNQLVGAQPAASSTTAAPQVVATPQIAQREQQQDEKTEQILQRLDQVNRQTDQHTLRQLQDDVNRLVGSLSESYLRNIRRVIERVNRTIGSSSSPLSATTGAPPAGALHQSNSENGPDGPRQPGFPGWDELIVAVDRMQKSLASFVRSSTKLITAGRRRR